MALFILTVRESGGPERRHRLEPGTHEVGRHPACAVVVTGADVSRRHCRLTLEKDSFTVEDLESSSGTRVAGDLLTGPRRFTCPQTLHLGSAAVRIEALNHKVRNLPEQENHHITLRADAAHRGHLPVAGLAEEVSLRLEMLYDLPLQFAGEPVLTKLCSLVLDRMISLIPGAKRGALLLAEKGTGAMKVCAAVPETEPPVSRTLMSRATAGHQGFIWREQEEETKKARSIISLGIRTGMYVPLLWKETALGIICVDNPQHANAFRDEDLRFMIFVAHYAAAAIANQLLQEDIEQNSRTLQNLLTNFSPKLRGKLLQKSREGRLQPGGEKSEVTILISDLRGFTRASAGMDSGAVVDMLNDYFSLLGDIIFQHDGAIDKFMGDAILAVFGSPEPDAAHALKAVRCAVAMRGAVEKINNRRRSGGMPFCESGFGIHTGEVLHGFIGAAERMEFTVIGDTVNKASRYCAGAGAGEILIGPATFAAVRGTVQAAARAVATKHEGELEGYVLLS